MILRERVTQCFKEGVAVCIIGQSGAGKGTLGKKIQELYYNQIGKKLFYFATGDAFRECMESGKFSAPNFVKIRNQLQEGKIINPIIAINLWSSALLYEYESGMILFDGLPRNDFEAEALKRFVEGYMEKKLVIISLDVSDETARHRINARNYDLVQSGKSPRLETMTPKAIEEKLAFYHTNVAPAIKWLRNNGVTVIDIDAELSKKKLAESAIISLTDAILGPSED